MLRSVVQVASARLASGAAAAAAAVQQVAAAAAPMRQQLAGPPASGAPTVGMLPLGARVFSAGGHFKRRTAAKAYKQRHPTGLKRRFR